MYKKTKISKQGKVGSLEPFFSFHFFGQVENNIVASQYNSLALL